MIEREQQYLVLFVYDNVVTWVLQGDKQELQKLVVFVYDKIATWVRRGV